MHYFQTMHIPCLHIYLYWIIGDNILYKEAHNFLRNLAGPTAQMYLLNYDSSIS